MSEQIPPHDLEAEAAVISAALVRGDGSVVDEVASIVRADQFFSEAHRRTWEAIVELHRTGKPQDLVSVASKLREIGRYEQVGGMPALLALVHAEGEIPNVAHYAVVVRDRWRVRKAIAAAQRIVASGYALAGDAQDFVDGAEHAFHELSRTANPSQLVPIGAVARDILQDIHESARTGVELVGRASGFPGLDRRMLGMRAGRLYVLAARPGVGKTSVAENIAHHVASVTGPGEVPAHVAFFTLEMGNKELAARSLAADSGVDGGRFVRTRDLKPDDWGRAADSARRMQSVRMHICDDPGITVFGMRALSRRLRADVERRGEKLALVVVDYLQLVEGHGGRRRGESREQEVAQISRGLKKLAKELDCAVLALSQLNRASEDGSRPKLRDLRESGAIEQDADVVVFIHPVPQPKAPGPTAIRSVVVPHEFIVAKSRGGETGIIRVAFDKPRTRFAEMSRDDEAAQ